MKTLLFITILAVCGSAAPMIATDSSDLEISARALELYLQDKSDYEKHCSFITWEQPGLDVYRATLVSQLPAGCVTNEDQ
jgi:hypothetical protein